MTVQFRNTIVTDTILLSAENTGVPGQPSGVTTPNSTLENDKMEDISLPLFTSTFETPGMEDYPEALADYPEPPEPDDPEPPAATRKVYDRPQTQDVS